MATPHTHEPVLCASCGRPLAVKDKPSHLCPLHQFTQGLRRFALDLNILW